MKAILKRQYEDSHRADAILRSVQPDNLKAPRGIRISCSNERGLIRITVECGKGLGALISTIDDLLSCIGAAERTLEALD